MSGSMDDVTVEVLDSRELALMLRVSNDGEVRVVCTIPKPDALDMLRHIADRWEADLLGGEEK